MSDVAHMTPKQKAELAMRRSTPYLPANVREQMGSMLSPASLAIITGTLIVWAGSHLFGVGEIVDLILVCAGALTLGLSVFDGARELQEFAKVSMHARTDADIDVAAHHFARAVTILGISIVQAVLLHGQARALRVRGRPRLRSYPPRISVGEPPPPGARLRVLRPATLGGASARTDAWGDVIEIARDQPLSEQRIALLHELVHRYLTPRTGVLRQLRNEARFNQYRRSAFLRYLEEALAEGYGQLKRNGFWSAVKAISYPLRSKSGKRPYVTVSQAWKEGKRLGTITLCGNRFYVTVGDLVEGPEHH